MDLERIFKSGKVPRVPIPNELKYILSHDLEQSLAVVSHHRNGANLLVVQDIQNLRSSDPSHIKRGNFLRILELVLFIEEFECRQMLKSYRMTRQSIIKYYDKDMPSQECSFKIFVEGLEEERPSLRCNDRVLVSHPKIEEKFIMVITHIIDCEIIVRADERFHRVYESCHLYNIEFVYNNYPERCCHYALNLVNKYNLVKCMFPADSIRSTIFLKETADNSKIFASSYQWFNNDIKHNKQQVQAIHKIITKSSRDTPYILYGPPGTGKTATIVEAICQAWKIIQQSDDPSKRILVCTPSNTSADVVAKRLRVYLKAKLLHRMYSLSTDIDTIDKDLLDCCNYRNGEVVMFSAYELPSIIVTTLCTCTRLIFLRLQPTNFSFIFIDEAGQANEAETIIPFTLSSNGSPEYKGRLHSQIILSGDPKQLGPTVFSRLAKPLLSISMLERLMSSDPYKKNRNGDYNPNYITKLIENYRSHPAIIHTSNKMFYNGELRSFESEDVRKGEGWKGLSNPKFPIKFDIVLGEEEKHHWTSSVYNTRELSSVMRHVHLLLDAKFGTRTLKGKDIGIITPFTSQKIRIKKLLKEANIVDIEVGTVQLFQGKEKEVMIFSTVRNKIFINDGERHIGFLSDKKLFNVALTRARCLLIVIGNPDVLKEDRSWNYFLSYCRKNAADRGMSYKLTGS